MAIKKQVAIDRFGRVLIPKRLRDELGLAAGSELRIRRDGDTLVLTPISPGAAIVEEDGMLVHTGEPTGDLESGLRISREDRILELIERSHDR
jgi:AbrB family looped-hinge helix DNA binding protein